MQAVFGEREHALDQAERLRRGLPGPVEDAESRDGQVLGSQVRNRRWRRIWFAGRGAVEHDLAADRQSAKNRGKDAAADGFEHDVESGHLDWAILGAVPEMLQTSYGSLTTGLDARPGQSILIRGGTSSVGLATAALARQRGMTVLSTTRNPGKAGAVTKAGADYALIDDGHVARQVREILPGGADTALELVGTPTLPDTLRSVRVHGVVCFTGMLSSQWAVRDFYPLDYLPTGVRLTAYKGDAADLPPQVLQDFLDAVAAGTAAVPVGHAYRFDQIVEAHTDMEQNRASGKLVVTT